MTCQSILQIGFGAFGATHLQAWQTLGMADRLIVADPNEPARAAAAALAPQSRQVADFRSALDECFAVDVLTPTDTHAAIACAALDAGKPVFVEKPMIGSTAEAERLLRHAQAANRPVVGGYYFRFHPKSLELRRQIQAGALGRLRLLSGRFAGFKRTRSDSGVVQNDAVHFLDLFCWLVGALPERVFALTRDHFDRGLDDLALISLEWTNGPVAQIEAGYVQPGKWPDAVVPGAVTSKEIAVSGALGAVEIDYAAETYVQHKVAHENHSGTWTPRFDGPAISHKVAAADAVQVVTAELKDYLRRIETPAPSSGFAGDGLDGGYSMALLLEAVEKSAREKRVVAMQEGTR